MRFKAIGLLLLLIATGYGPARGDTLLTLDRAIARARAGSVDAAVALDRLRSAYWTYRAYRASLLPEFSLSATLPSYSKQYSTYMDGDGDYSFVASHVMELQGRLSVAQNIWLTGGTLSVSTQLNFLRQFSGTPYSRFMTIPIALTLNQPLFAANHVKWDRKIEPVRYREAQAEYLSATEDVAINAIQLYFTLLMAGENLSIASQNLDNAKKLYDVAIEKRDMGIISKNDLLQMELNLIEAQSSMTDCESDLRNARFRLATFLDLGDDCANILTTVPEEIPDVEIPFDMAYAKALENNKFAHTQARSLLEADYAVATARGDMRKINLYAQIGFTGADDNIRSSYSRLKDNQLVEIGVEIPLVDWGKRRGKLKVAESNRDVTRSRMRQEAQSFRQDIYMIVERYSNQRQQLRLAQRADTIAAKRYATNVETYLTGRLSTLDLNDSRVTKDQARREYFNELYLYWLYYYQLRSLTLWDFATSAPIDADFDTLM